MINDRRSSMGRKLSRSFLLVAAMGTWLWLGAEKPVLGGVGVPELQAKPSAAPAPASQKGATAKNPPRAPSAKPSKKVTAPKGPPAKPKAGEQPESPSAPKLSYADKRDPFKVLGRPGLVTQPGGQDLGGALPPGVRGLVIGPLILEGIVRLDTSNTMIAVVTNNTKRAYFLRENDSVYNGVVSKITPDAVYFKENFLDLSGRMSSHEVVKRMGPAPGEGK